MDPPVPDFQLRLNNASGPVQDVFCLGESIYFDNLSGGGLDYTWELYDDTTASVLLETLNEANPIYTYNSAGYKLIRLTVSNPGVDGNCIVSTEKIIRTSPAALAAIELWDPSFIQPDEGMFCAVDNNEIVTVGLRDATTTIEPETVWRWEFYDTNGNLEESIPAGSTTFGSQVTDFTSDFTGKGIHRIRLIAKNNDTGCESVAEDSVIIYDIPEVIFDVDTVCEGERTTFSNISDSITSLVPRIQEDRVILYEWDLSYDGMVFNPELSFSRGQSFSFYLDGTDFSGNEPSSSVAGSYTVALRMTTEKANCSGIYSREVVITPLPVLSFTSSYDRPVCPGSSIVFSNTSLTSDTQFQLTVTDSLTYQQVIPSYQSDTTLTFFNDTDSVKTYFVWLEGVTDQGCKLFTGPDVIEVLPETGSGFIDPEYSVLGSNCSVWESTFEVDESTKALNAESYIWTIFDQNNILPGYPIIKNSGDSNYHTLDYSLINTSGSNRLLTAVLQPQKSGICIAPDTMQLVINPSPESTFTYQKTDSCDFVQIDFDADQPGLTDYEWSFTPISDQRLDEADRQTLIYLRPDTGDLNVSAELFTRNLAGCTSDTTSASLMVEQSEASFDASFEIGSDTITLPESLQITNLSTVGLNYHWDFGNGITAMQFDPGEISYMTSGIYRITLEVTGKFCVSRTSKNVVVLPGQPIVDFEADTVQGCTPLVVNFIDQSQSTVFDTYEWDFGDGFTSTERNPTHIYRTAGRYTVTLYAENELGVGDELVRENYIEVYSRAIADFSVNPQTVFIPDQTVFFNNNSINAFAFEWDFGDGSISMERTPTHKYESKGIYDISLIALSEVGCSDTLTISNAVEAIDGGQAKIPNAFSPGASGVGGGGSINDIFLPGVEGVTKFNMQIYNKWGQLLFESNSQDLGWNGYYKGTLQPADVYVFRLELEYSDGREVVKIGDVTLVR